MQILKKQKGTGMIEILVALVLLAIGVLGFTALQLRAVEATSEAFNRIQAMVVARDFAERIRINPYALSVLKKDNTAISTDTDQSAYIEAVADNKDAVSVYVWDKCYETKTCTSAEMAVEDVLQVTYKAAQNGMKMNLINCQSSITNSSNDAAGNVTQTTSALAIANSRKCIYVAWDKTLPVDGSGADDCTQYGIYKDDSKCVVLEAY
ncbi:type IV pilus modification protein PilV [Acinetobacter sp. ULE_I010]|uniref:type IV pilus modification protein PilV n=1 Tax=Acinetobacter sp. ULE_I010 TaxID=3373065 RepID=UPI003AF9764E